jgi:hypothetical protein
MKGIAMKPMAVAVFAAAAAAAGAVYYLDERFEGTQFPPPGWTVANYNGVTWSQGTGGPQGKYARGFGNPPLYSGGYAVLESPSMNIPQGRTAYVRFGYYLYLTGPPPSSYFYLLYPDTGEYLITWHPTIMSSWLFYTGNAVVSRNAPVKGRWRVYLITAPSQALVDFRVDTAQISDEDLTAVLPASLGRVKAIYR